MNVSKLAGALIASCGLVHGATADADSAMNMLTQQERETGWDLLFDGQSLKGWRGYSATAIPDGWRIDQGTLHFSAGKGDLVTDGVYGNFELSLEWKISPGGNSGIFYLATLGFEQIYLGAPEMQVLDDAVHVDGGDPLTSAGAAYGLYPAPRGVVHSAGEWNQVKLRVVDGHVTHWLNGEEIVSYTLGSAEWTSKVASSKFNKWPMYGQARVGHIGLQDHGDPVWYRNIKVRNLD
jgi:hypothetical protein